MISIKSERAKKLLASPEVVKTTLLPTMRRYPGNDLKAWAHLEWGEENVKNLAFFGEFDSLEKLMLEAMGKLMIGRPMSRIDTLTVRECEAFLRDKNSEMALDGLSDSVEEKFKKFFQWIRQWPRNTTHEEYHFSSDNGPFVRLKLVEKVREIKAFLSSSQIINLYHQVALPELVDVDELTVYVQVPYASEKEKALFEELHLLGVEAFQEEHLNFIPEA